MPYRNRNTDLSGTRRPKDVQSLCRQLTEEAVDQLAGIMRDGREDAADRIRAASTIIERGWGKVRQDVGLEVRPVEQLSEQELVQLLGGEAQAREAVTQETSTSHRLDSDNGADSHGAGKQDPGHGR